MPTYFWGASGASKLEDVLRMPLDGLFCKFSIGSTLLLPAISAVPKFNNREK